MWGYLLYIVVGGLWIQFAPALGRVGDRGRFACVWLELSWLRVGRGDAMRCVDLVFGIWLWMACFCTSCFWVGRCAILSVRGSEFVGGCGSVGNSGNRWSLVLLWRASLAGGFKWDGRGMTCMKGANANARRKHNYQRIENGGFLRLATQHLLPTVGRMEVR